MAWCQKCGVVYSDKVNFCTRCGIGLKKGQEDDLVFGSCGEWF